MCPVYTAKQEKVTSCRATPGVHPRSSERFSYAQTVHRMRMHVLRGPSIGVRVIYDDEAVVKKL